MMFVMYRLAFAYLSCYFICIMQFILALTEECIANSREISDDFITEVSHLISISQPYEIIAY